MRSFNLAGSITFLLILFSAHCVAQHHTLELDELSRFAYCVNGSGSNRIPWVQDQYIYFPDTYGVQVCQWDSTSGTCTEYEHVALPGSSWELTGYNDCLYVKIEYASATTVTSDMPKLVQLDCSDPDDIQISGELPATSDNCSFSNLHAVNGYLLAARQQNGLLDALLAINPTSLDVLFAYPDMYRYAVLPGSRIITRRADETLFEIYSVDAQEGLVLQQTLQLPYETNTFPFFLNVGSNCIATQTHDSILIWDTTGEDWLLLSTIARGSRYPAVVHNNLLLFHHRADLTLLDSIFVYDVSDVNTPEHITTQAFPEQTRPFMGGYFSMMLSGATLFVHGGAQGYFRLAINDTGQIEYAGSCYECQTVVASGRVWGQYVLLPTAWRGILAYDVSDPQNPTESFQLFDGCSMQIDVQGDLLYAYCVEWTDRYEYSERIYTIADIQNPQLLYMQDVVHSNSLFFNPLEQNVFYRFDYTNSCFQKYVIVDGSSALAWEWAFDAIVVNPTFAGNFLYALSEESTARRNLFVFDGFAGNEPSLVEAQPGVVPPFARMNRAGGFAYLHDTGSSPENARFLSPGDEFSVENGLYGIAGDSFAGVGHETDIAFYDLSRPLTGFLQPDTTIPQPTTTLYAHWAYPHLYLFHNCCVSIYSYAILDADHPSVSAPQSCITAVPNPFKPETTLRFTLAQPGPVRLEVYNIRGQRVRTLLHQPMPAGNHYVQWDGRDDTGRPAASGVYFARVQSAGNTQTTKLLLLK